MTTEQLAASMAQADNEIADLEAKAANLQTRQQAAEDECNSATAAILNSEPGAARRASEARITLDALTAELQRQRGEIQKAKAHHAELARRHTEAQKFDRLASIALTAQQHREQMEQIFTSTAAALQSGLSNINSLLDKLAELRTQFVYEVQASGVAEDITRRDFDGREQQKMETLQSQLRQLCAELAARGLDLSVLCDYEHPRPTRPFVYPTISIHYQIPQMPGGEELQTLINDARGKVEDERRWRALHSTH